jgi:glycosyltransferase involved in cell wall biosynthesis
MKIALIHYRLILRGGLERRLINYTHWLIKEGHEVHIVVAKKTDDVVLPEGAVVHKLSLGIMPKVFRQRYFDYRLGKFMQQHQFDASLSLMRTSHQDLVLCPGNHLGYLQSQNKRATRLKDVEQIKCDRLAFERSKKILAASGMMADEAVGLYGVDPKKVLVLHPPVNDQLFNKQLKGNSIFFREKYRLPQNKRLFLFVSSSHQRKGLPVLLRCFEQLQQTDAVLVIAGLPKVHSSLTNVIDCQFVPAMEELYAACDFTIHPAMYEPFGQIVPESLCCGTPVIISDMVGAKEIVEAGEGLVLSLNNEHAWIETIRNAQPASFHIQDEVAARKGLLVDQHMRRIMNAIASLNQ